MLLCRFLTLIAVSILPPPSSSSNTSNIRLIFKDFQSSNNLICLFPGKVIFHQGVAYSIDPQFLYEAQVESCGNYLIPIKDKFYLISSQGVVHKLQGNPKLRPQCSLQLFDKVDQSQMHYLAFSDSRNDRIIKAQSGSPKIHINDITANCHRKSSIVIESPGYTDFIGMFDYSVNPSENPVYFYVLWHHNGSQVKIGRICTFDTTFKSYTDVGLKCGSFGKASASTRDTLSNSARLFVAWYEGEKTGLCSYPMKKIDPIIDEARTKCGKPARDTSEVWTKEGSGMAKCRAESFSHCQLDKIVNNRVFSNLKVPGEVIMEEQVSMFQILRIWKTSPFTLNNIYCLGNHMIVGSLTYEGENIRIARKRSLDLKGKTGQRFTIHLENVTISWTQDDFLPLVNCAWLSAIDCISYGPAYNCQWCEKVCREKNKCSGSVNSDVLVKGISPQRIHSNNSDLFIEFYQPVDPRVTVKHVKITGIECRHPYLVNNTFLKCKTVSEVTHEFNKKIQIQVIIELDYAFQSLSSRSFEISLIDPRLKEIIPSDIVLGHVGWIGMHIQVGYEDEKDMTLIVDQKNACQKITTIERGHYKCLFSVESSKPGHIVLQLKIPAGIYNNKTLTLHLRPNLTLIGRPTFPEARIEFQIKASSSLSGFFEPKVGTSNNPGGGQLEKCAKDKDKLQCKSPEIQPIQEPLEVSLVIISHGTVVSGYPDLKLKYLPTPVLSKADYKTEEDLVTLKLKGFDTSYRLKIYLKNPDLQRRIDCLDSALLEASVIGCRPRVKLRRVPGWVAFVGIGSWEGASDEVTFDGELLKRPVNLLIVSVFIIGAIIVLALLFVIISYLLYKYLRFGSAKFNNYIEGTVITAYATIRKRAKSFTSRASSLSGPTSTKSSKQFGATPIKDFKASKTASSKKENEPVALHSRSETGLFSIESPKKVKK